VLNPALAEMVASDRMNELRRTGPRRSSRARSVVASEAASPQAALRRDDHLANAQRAIGWFLVSVGLRLALPRARTGAVR
jgi:hypothetical protein